MNLVGSLWWFQYDGTIYECTGDAGNGQVYLKPEGQKGGPWSLVPLALLANKNWYEPVTSRAQHRLRME